jgi:hypothetical protein
MGLYKTGKISTIFVGYTSTVCSTISIGPVSVSRLQFPDAVVVCRKAYYYNKSPISVIPYFRFNHQLRPFFLPSKQFTLSINQ